MQFQVPQFIDTEDKIVGPLTIRQFVYVVIAAAASVLLYFSVQVWLWLTLSVPILGLGGALAFAKINGRPFAKFLSATLGFYWKPQTYVWQAEKPSHTAKAEISGEESAPAGFSVEKLLAGMALKKTWSKVQAGSAAKDDAEPPKKHRRTTERYQIFHKISGEQQAAKRIDYR